MKRNSFILLHTKGHGVLLKSRIFISMRPTSLLLCNLLFVFVLSILYDFLIKNMLFAFQPNLLFCVLKHLSNCYNSFTSVIKVSFHFAHVSLSGTHFNLPHYYYAIQECFHSPLGPTSLTKARRHHKKICSFIVPPSIPLIA